jgi:hypothetical protein
MFVYIYKWLKNAVFRTLASAIRCKRASSADSTVAAIYTYVPNILFLLRFSLCLSRACLGKTDDDFDAKK